ncbi:hypothetical protein [Sphingomonas sp. KC8]|uniref:hypothetical protein n=1 Tax=Sphingomonas sp. KC8 TaxID=1030157 RepID=UPI001110ADBB|nr:hypothetical protein [Sphingomonas sp. KC8]
MPMMFPVGNPLPLPASRHIFQAVAFFVFCCAMKSSSRRPGVKRIPILTLKYRNFAGLFVPIGVQCRR